MQSPRGGGTADGKVAVTTAYDGRRLVNSPTSLQACRMEGVAPELLLLRDLQRGKLDPRDDPYTACVCANPEQLQMKKDFIERKRKALVSAVHATRERLLVAAKRSEATGTKLPNLTTAALASSQSAARADTAGGDDDGLAASRSAASPRSSKGGAKGTPRAPGSFHNVTMPSDSTEVAQYFESLRQQAESDATRRARWDEKMEKVESKIRDASARRAERAAQSGATLDQKVSQARQRAEQQAEEKRRHNEELLEREEQKLRTISEQRSVRHKSLKKSDRGRREREAAVQREEAKQDALRERMEKANASSKEAHDRAAKERELRGFMTELQTAAYRDQTRRAQRARESRTLNLEGRLHEAVARRQQAANENEQAKFQKALQREIIMRQKHEIAEQFRAAGSGTSPVPQPPQWLESQMKVLKEKQQASSARGPRPPSHARPEPPRTARSNQAARSFKVREPFTIGGGAQSVEKQAFAPWMFQSY